jgi:hypothetical protein
VSFSLGFWRECSYLAERRAESHDRPALIAHDVISGAATKFAPVFSGDVESRHLLAPLEVLAYGWRGHLDQPARTERKPRVTLHCGSFRELDANWPVQRVADRISRPQLAAISRGYARSCVRRRR